MTKNEKIQFLLKFTDEVTIFPDKKYNFLESKE